jgi:hypothetical protein
LKTGCFELLIVAGDAVLVEEGALRREGGSLGGGDHRATKGRNSTQQQNLDHAGPSRKLSRWSGGVKKPSRAGSTPYLSDVRFGSYGNSALFWAVSGPAFPDWKAFCDDIGSEKAIVGPIVTAKKPVQAPWDAKSFIPWVILFR